MKRFLPLALASLMFFTGAAFAQDAYDDGSNLQEEHENEDIVRYEHIQFNHEGDQYLRVSLNLDIPIHPLNPFDDGHLNIGGMGTLGYNYFLTDSFSAGIEVGFGFNSTIGENILNYIPILLTGTWHPSLGRFEFPLTVGIGFAWETYNSYTYWPGLVIKPEAGVHYRIGDSWSIGVDVSYAFMPEFCKFWGTGDENIWMQFFNVGVVARYFF